MTPPAVPGSGRAVVSHRLRQLLLWGALLTVLGLGGFSAATQLWAEYQYRAAQAAMEKRDFAQAEVHVTACLQVWPRSALTHLLAARIARRANDYDKAETHLAACKRLGPPEGFDLERVLLLVQQGEQLDNVGEYLQKCQQEHPEDAVLILEALSQGYMQMYRLGDLLACVDTWLQRQPRDSLAFFRRGWACERLELIPEAQQAYRRVLELDPTNEAAQLQLAQTLLRAGSPDEAVALFESLRQRQPGNLAVGLGMAEARSQSGRIEEAGEFLEELAVEHPRDPLVLAARGKVARQLGRAEDAENWLRQAVALAPFSFEANYSLWECLLARGKKAEADECQAKVKQIEADLSRVKALAVALQQAPSDLNIRCEMGTTYLRLGNAEQGLRWLNTVLQQDPSHPQARQALAEYSQRSGLPALAAPDRPLSQPGNGPGPREASKNGP
jgi:predicted Zn-dependent protease